MMGATAPVTTEDLPMIDISGLDKADVLAALYNAAQPRGLGHLQFDPEPMTREKAAGACSAWRPGPISTISGGVS